MSSIRDYKAEYSCPEDVLEDDRLNREQKIAVLADWQLDAQRRDSSSSEGMSPADAGAEMPSQNGRPQLAQVNRALQALLDPA